MTTRALLTGVGGFIGSHTAQWILEHTDWDLVGIDSWQLRHRSSPSRLQAVQKNVTPEQWDRLKLMQWDLSHEFTTPFRNELFDAGPIDYWINMASDSHVARSIDRPGACWLNNVHLVYNMLELARVGKPRVFIQVSTDEVYGDSGWSGPGHAEWSSMLPSNPYAASKAAQEALATSYWRTYNVPVVITNTMNAVGEWQDPEKFLPMVINRLTNDKPIVLHGESDNKLARRVWLDAKNMAAALVYICKQGPPTAFRHPEDRPDRFHIIGETELNVGELVHRVAGKLGVVAKTRLVHGDTVRPGYDRRYALQDNLLRASGFNYPFELDTTLDRIIEWVRANPNWIYED